MYQLSIVHYPFLQVLTSWLMVSKKPWSPITHHQLFIHPKNQNCGQKASLFWVKGILVPSFAAGPTTKPASNATHWWVRISSKCIAQPELWSVEAIVKKGWTNDKWTQLNSQLPFKTLREWKAGPIMDTRTGTCQCHVASSYKVHMALAIDM